MFFSAYLFRCYTTSVTMTISDRGPGVPEAERELIFEKFRQSSVTKTGAGGTGLGLSICREIIAAHHGRIWVENRPEGGSAFMVELPLDPPSRSPVDMGITPQESASEPDTTTPQN